MSSMNYTIETKQKTPIYFSSEQDFNDLSRHIDTLDFDKIIIITDTKVKKLYWDKLKRLFDDYNIKLIALPQGEKVKSFFYYNRVSRRILNDGISKKSLIVSIGGGVIGNLSGLIAGTLYRGIQLIYVPTTLLAQADSSTGGKCGINTQHGKNIIGLFYEPVFIYVNNTFLNTLSEKEINSGISECIKHGLCQDKGLLDLLDKQSNSKYLEIVKKTVSLKVEILNKDRNERTIGKTLMYGHTIGHAIESICLNKITHGESISIGMTFCSFVAWKEGVSSQSLFEYHKQMFTSWSLPIHIPKKATPKKILQKLSYDKKHASSEVELILLKEIGVICPTNNYSTPFSRDKLLYYLDLYIKETNL